MAFNKFDKVKINSLDKVMFFLSRTKNSLKVYIEKILDVDITARTANKNAHRV